MNGSTKIFLFARLPVFVSGMWTWSLCLVKDDGLCNNHMFVCNCYWTHSKTTSDFISCLVVIDIVDNNTITILHMIAKQINDVNVVSVVISLVVISLVAFYWPLYNIKLSFKYEIINTMYYK